MSSFCCPHFDMERDHCLKCRTSCVPGQPGCVLRHNSVFAVPVEERMSTRDGRMGREATASDGDRSAEQG